MKSQFTGFTGQGTTTMLGKFRSERRERAMASDEARKIFQSEIRSGVRALLDRCELTRKSLASDIRAASEAFRDSRPRKAPRQAPRAGA